MNVLHVFYLPFTDTYKKSVSCQVALAGNCVVFIYYFGLCVSHTLHEQPAQTQLKTSFFAFLRQPLPIQRLGHGRMLVPVASASLARAAAAA